MKTFNSLLLLGCSALALAGCGADDISSPGGDGIVINNPGSTPTPTPTPGTGLVTAADSCPTFAATGGLTNDGVVEGPEGSWRICTLPALIDKSASLPKVAGVLYRMNGRVDVGCDGGFAAPTAAKPFTTTTASCQGKVMTADDNVTLTVDPGVIIYGENGSDPAWMAVNRGNKISATGTAAKPIIFTSAENVTGKATDASMGQWGGLVLLGRGITTDCTAGGSTASNTCERETEGSATPANFGGNDNTYNAGTLKYVQIRYSGYSLSPGAELQSLTTGAIGSGTTLEYFQSVNSSDDGAEFFGGAVNFKHYIAVNADDDSLDMDTGLVGNFQYVIVAQRAAGGDAFFEIDSNGNESDQPRQKSTIANFTLVQPNGNANNSDLASILIRGNADVNLVNGIVLNKNNECIRLNGSGATPATFTANSVVMTCGDTGPFLGTGTYTNADTEAMFDKGALNNAAFTSTLTGLFINGTNESGVTAYANIKALSAFFDTVTYIGAVKDANDTWYKGWTCDNATASFGSGSACTALPVT